MTTAGRLILKEGTAPVGPGGGSGVVYFDDADGKLYYTNSTTGTTVGPLDVGAGASGLFIYQPGGITGGSIYATWSDLETAVNAFDGPKIVYLDDSGGGTIQIPANTNFDIEGWEIRSFPGKRLTLFIGVDSQQVFSPGGIIPFNLTLNSANLFMSGGTTVPGFTLESGTALQLRMDNAEVRGISAAEPLFYLANTAAFCSGFNADLRGFSYLSSYSASLEGLLQSAVYLRDSSEVVNDAITDGPGGPPTGPNFVYHGGGVARFYQQTNFTGGIDYVGAKENYLVFNESQLGTTELHIGSIYVDSEAVILSGSLAMLGGSSTGAVVNIRKYTGGTLVGTFDSNDVPIGSVSLGTDIVVMSGDWYEFYLAGKTAGDTAICKGITLNILPLT